MSLREGGREVEFGNLDPIGTEADGRVKIIESGLKGHHTGAGMHCHASGLGTFSFLKVPPGCLMLVTLLIAFIMK